MIPDVPASAASEQTSSATAMEAGPGAMHKAEEFPPAAAITPSSLLRPQAPSPPPSPHRIGKDGLLSLSFCHDGGRTALAGCRTEPPLSVQRALYCERGLPEMAYVYVSSTSGGILQGDRHVISISLDEGAKAHITTQGATRIYGTDRQGAAAAHQAMQISVGSNAYLEYVPDQTIPYADSAFFQDATLSVHDTATVAYAEILSPGRAGMGESFAYRLYGARIRAANQDGRHRFADAARVAPQSSRIGVLGVMGGYDTVASMHVITEPRHVGKLQKSMDEMILQRSGDGVIGGAAVMANEEGVLVRLLGTGSEQIKSVIHEAVSIVRRTVLDAPFTHVRKS